MKASFSILFTALFLFCSFLSCSETAATKDQIVQTENKKNTEVSTDTIKKEPAATTQQVETKTNNINLESSTTPNKDDAPLLLDIIKEQQILLVRRSCGIYAYECFTDSDLASFKAEQTEQRAVEDMKASSVFNKKILPAIKTLTQDEWRVLREEAMRTRRPTWAEQGSINCKGQTEAGAEAETRVANSIIVLVESQR